MAYTASGVLRDPTTRTTVGTAGKVFAYRRDTGAAAPTASKNVGSDGTFSFTDFVEGVEYDVIGDVGAGQLFHVPVTISAAQKQNNRQNFTWSNASTASNGANAVIARFAPLGHAVRIKQAFWSPTGTDNATHGTATTSATYRRIQLVNGGSLGTNSTNVLASFNLTVSQASLGTVAGVVDSTITVASNEVVYMSQLTVGGTDNDGTILQAGVGSVEYELI